MSIAAAQAAKFYEQVARDGRVFTFLNDGGMLVYPVGEIEVVPFWSSYSRMVSVQRKHEKYRTYSIDKLTLAAFLQKTLPQLAEDGIHVGVNWAGKRLVGYNPSVDSVVASLKHWCDKLEVEL